MFFDQCDLVHLFFIICDWSQNIPIYIHFEYVTLYLISLNLGKVAYNHTGLIEKAKDPLPASVIGKAIKNIIQNSKPKTRYVYTKDKFQEFTVPGILSDRTLDRLMAKRLKIEKKD